jgi:hypothetical protein
MLAAASALETLMASAEALASVSSELNIESKWILLSSILVILSLWVRFP